MHSPKARTAMTILRLGWGIFMCIFSLLLCVGGIGMILAEISMQEAGMENARGGIGVAMGVGQLILGLSGNIVGIRFIARARSAVGGN